MKTNYQEFLQSKRFEMSPVGKEVDPSEINPNMFDFQRDIVRWALKKGRCAIFAGTGLGKTFMQVEWARLIRGNGRVLIFAPLAVAQQTVKESSKFGIDVRYCQKQSDVFDGINITNYERMNNFDMSQFIAVVLDESSILKSMTGTMRTQLIKNCAHVPYRLACTATPAPNDHMELCNHAEFLGIMTATEMLCTFFTHDGGNTSKWRLKKHAVKNFWDWVATWSVMLTNPEDLGYDGKRFELPPIQLHEHVTETENDGNFLFPMEAQTLQERRNARRGSILERVNECIDIITHDDDRDAQWLIWCNLNDEADAIKRLVPEAVEVRGSDDPERKKTASLDFADGKIKILVSKPSIFGMGLNFQNCHKIVFLGLSDSFEEYYQAVRRCWRFGQTKQVDVHVITDIQEGAVVENIKRKERLFNQMLKGMINSFQRIGTNNITSTQRETDLYQPQTRMSLPNWI